jgi:glycine/sarcosine N-methyltransferase
VTDDPYAEFAERYDLFHRSFDEQNPERVEFFRTIFSRNKVRTVLDCACGTGRDLALFHSLGLQVWGSDLSESMLTVARKNLAQRGLSIPLGKVDYRKLATHYDRSFDAVVCLAGSILEMPTETEVGKAFGSMWEVLSQGGVLVLSQGTTDKQWHERPRFIPAVNREDFSRVFVIDYENQGARYHVLDIFHSAERHEFRVWTAHYHKMLLRHDLERILLQGGFTGIDFYGSYKAPPYDKASSDMLITVARK